MRQKRLWQRILAVVATLSVLGVVAPSGAGADQHTHDDVGDYELSNDEFLMRTRAELLAAATTHNVALLVEADLANYDGDIDEALLNRLIDEETPIGRDNAEKWVSSLSESDLRLAKIERANECLDAKRGCKDPEFCLFSGKRASCMVTSCGDGACKACWDVFGDLRKLAVKGWCAYTCQQGTAIVGIKLVLQVRILGELSACLPLSTPVP